METTLKNKYSLMLRLCLILAKSSGAVTIGEIVNLVRLFLIRFGEEANDFINDEEIQKLVDDPGEVNEICHAIVETHERREIGTIFLNLMSMLYVDGVDPSEFMMVIDIGQLLGLKQFEMNFFFDIFGGFFDNLSDSTYALSIGNQNSNADIPVYNLDGKAAFARVTDGMYLVVHHPTDLSFNKKMIHKYTVRALDYNDFLTVGDSVIEYQDLLNLFYNKIFPQEPENFLLVVNSEQKLHLISDDGRDENSKFTILSKLSKSSNKISLEPVSNHYPLLIDGEEIKEQEKIVIFDWQEISYNGINGEVRLAPNYNVKTFIEDISKINEEPVTIDLYKYDNKLDTDCQLVLTKDNEGQITINVKNYSGDILVSGKKAELPITYHHLDLTKIGNIIIDIDWEHDLLRLNKKELDPARKETKFIKMQDEEDYKGRVSNLLIENLYLKFPRKKNYALNNISFELHSGQMCAILGPSGSGKSTLLNAILGLTPIDKGAVKVNDIPLKHGMSDIKEVIGFVPQDDLLIDVFTVWENLYYKYKLIKPHVSDKKKIERDLDDIIQKVGLVEKKHSKVGSALERTLSGGERKRVNIALELIMKPDVLVLDEPTTGLSSHDAEEIVDMLRRMSNQGKIVLMVIHQPSSDLYKMFDKVLILNKGGQLAYFGNQYDALHLFKEVLGETYDVVCGTCKRVNPDLLMKALTSESTHFWGAISHLKNAFTSEKVIDAHPANDLSVPETKRLTAFNFIKQGRNQFKRLFMQKLRDKLNIGVTLIMSPALSVLTSTLLRYTPDPNQPYEFQTNNMYPTFLFLVVIVAIFFGLSNSMPEIIRDRLILKRERLLNISLTGYFASKVIVLLIFAIIQNILFIVPAHFILEEYDFIFYHICFMTVISACGIGFGLLGSTFLKSINAAYNLVPLILIPQIILGGALVQFEQLNKKLFFNKESPVPEMAQVMISRWGYEMLITANISLNEYTEIEDEQQRLLDENNAIYNERKENASSTEEMRNLSIEQNKNNDKIVQYFSEQLAEADEKFNNTIEDVSITIVEPNNYLATTNSWFHSIVNDENDADSQITESDEEILTEEQEAPVGPIPTWFRDLAILVAYMTGLLLLAYFRLITLKL